MKHFDLVKNIDKEKKATFKNKMPALRKHLRQLKPYPIPIKPDVVDDNLLRLDANENFFELDPSIVTAAQQACLESQGYPDDFAAPLRHEIASVHEIDPDRISCARGAMELISLLVNLYLESGSNAVVTEFGYLYFRTAISYSGAEIRMAEESNLTVDTSSILKAIDADTRIVFLANPGNPSGTIINNDAIVQLRQDMPDEVLLVLDEAYFEYVDPQALSPNFNLVDTTNTVVLRTFSKIYGLAGYRVGWGYLPAQIARDIRIIQQPNTVTHVSQIAAKAAMVNQTAAIALRLKNQTTRTIFSNSLEKLGLIVTSSHTNFVLVNFEQVEVATFIEQSLRKQGILVRPMNAYLLPTYLRITIGKSEDMEHVADAIGKLLG